MGAHRELTALRVLFTAGLIAASAEGGLDVPLTITERAGVARDGEPVTSGVPLGEGDFVLDPARLGVFDPAGREVPAQIRVQSRWGGPPSESARPIKWLLVDFQASVPAHGTVVYRLREGASGPAAPSPIAIEETASGIAVSTGPLRFEVSRGGFDLFRRLSLNGRELIVPDAGNGGVITEYRGTVHASAAAPPTRLYLEESGPLRAVVRVEGTHRAGGADLLRYVARIHAYAGRDFVRVHHTLQNPQSYGYLRNRPATFPYFSEMHLGLRLALGTTPAVRFPDGVLPLPSGASRTLEVDQVGALPGSSLDDRNYNVEDNFVRRVRDQAGQLLSSVGGLDGQASGATDGLLDLSGGGWGVTAAVRHFWQNFPKSMTARADGRIEIGLWPAFGQGLDEGYYRNHPAPAEALDDYCLAGGRWKTHEVYLGFHLGDSETGRAEARVRAFQDPLFARADAAHVARTAAVEVMRERRDWAAEAALPAPVRESLTRYERFQRVRWDDAAADPVASIGRVSYPTFRRRGGPWGGRQFYGWMSFGDIPWGDGYSSGHYDWAWSSLLHFLRTGDLGLLDLGVEMTRHRMDLDNYHTTEDAVWVNGGQRFEKGQTHGDMTVPPTPSHTWVQGLLLYSALTGDSLARETALEVGAFYRGYWSRYGAPGYGVGPEVRLAGWSILGLTELYNYLGDPSWLPLAAGLIRGFSNLSGGRGYVLESDGHCDPWQFGIFLGAVGKYAVAVGGFDPVANRVATEIADWLIGAPTERGPLVGGWGTDAAYVPWALYYHWNADPGRRDAPDRAHLAHVVDGLAYAWLLTARPEYRDWARVLAGDLWRWWQVGWGNAVDRRLVGQYSAITMRPVAFPNTESKTLGWLGRYGHVYGQIEAAAALDPALSVEIDPGDGEVDQVSRVRVRVRTRDPVLLAGGLRTYYGLLWWDTIDITPVLGWVLHPYRTPFEETWAAHVVLPRGTGRPGADVWNLLGPEHASVRRLWTVR
jgi:hypothetical protein